MRLYIAGKITGLHVDEAFEMFERGEEIVTRCGHRAVNPMTEVEQTPGREWIDYMRDGIRLLIECDGIFMLSNWGDSPGARLEKLIAEGLGLQIFYANRAADLQKLAGAVAVSSER